MKKIFTKNSLFITIFGFLIAEIGCIYLSPFLRSWQTWNELEKTQVETEATIVQRKVGFTQNSHNRYYLTYEFSVAQENKLQKNIHTQQVSEKLFYSKPDGSKTKIIYASINPNNTLILGTEKNPIIKLVIVSVMAMGGTSLFIIGCFNLKTENKRQNQYINQQMANS
jgi:hypothetical protein